MKNDREPRAGRESGWHGFAQQVLVELHAIAADIWLQDRTSLAFHRIVAIGVSPADLFQRQSTQQYLLKLLTETTGLVAARTVLVPGLMDSAEAESLVILVPISHETVLLGVLVVVPQAGLEAPELARQLDWLTEKCIALGIRLGSVLRNPPQPVESSVATPDTESTPSAANVKVTGTEVQAGGVGMRASETSAVSVAAAEPSDHAHVRDARLEDLRPIMGFVLGLQRSLDLVEVAEVVANEGRLLFGSDRVSVVLRRGRRAVVTAVSGQESVQSRGNLTRAMRTLAKQVLATGDVLRSDVPLEELPPRQQQPLAEFVQEGQARFVLMVPLWKPERLVPAEDALTSARPITTPRQVIGVLVIEQMSSSEPAPQLEAKLAAVVDHIAAALFNARTHSTIFLLPLWRSIGRFREWLRGWRLAGAICLVLALTGFGISLAIVPWEYRVDATGRLMPVIQREVFAPWDGQVVALLITEGERVEAGSPLITIHNDDLTAERATLENKLLEKRKLLASLTAQRNAAEEQGNRDEALKLQGKIVETKVELEGATRQLEILKDRVDRLTVRAPITGVVTTFQIHQLLQGRPVQRGEVLLQVMDDRGDWHLELEVPEHRLGRILKEQQRQRAALRAEGTDDTSLGVGVSIGANVPLSELDRTEPVTTDSSSPKEAFAELNIKYSLLTRPESSYVARLTTLATRAVPADPQGSVVEAQATLDKTNLPECTIGAEVRARISCGTSNLGDVLFGDVIEFVQKYLWW